MFRKLLNVGKGHSNDRLQQQQLQQKNLFQLNEIRSYGFSHLCCLAYSPSLSLLAVGSKHGLLRVLGNPSVEFSHQLASANSIRQIEFIDCRGSSKQSPSDGSPSQYGASAKLVVLTDNGQLHLFELKTVRQQNFADNTTQTDSLAGCCQHNATNHQESSQTNGQSGPSVPEYTKLELVGKLDYFKFKPDDEDRSKRVTTLEISADGQVVYVGTEGGSLYLIPLNKFESTEQQKQVQQDEARREAGVKPIPEVDKIVDDATNDDSGKEDDTTAVNLNDEPTQVEEVVEPYEIIKFEEDVGEQLGDEIRSKKQGAIESIKKHPTSNDKLLLSYHRGLNVIYDVQSKIVDKYFYHNQKLESSCFAGQSGEFFYTSHNDGSYIKWDTRKESQTKANEDFLGQLYGPYPCKPTPKIQACTGLVNDQLEDLVIFTGGMPRATYDDKNPVTIVRAELDGKDTIKTVLDFTSKVLDFVVITRPRGNLGAGAKSTGGGGKKGKHKQQQQQHQQRNNPIAVALAILAEEEFVVIDLLNSESYLEFTLPYLNCVHSSAITCNQHYSDISDELYGQLLAYNKQQLKGKLSQNEWPITGGKVIDAPDVKSHDILLTGHEDGSVDFWDVSDLSMRHLLHLSTARFFSTNDDDLVPIDGLADSSKPNGANQDNSEGANESNESNHQDTSNAWPPLKRVGRFDPYSDDTRLAVRRLSLCSKAGTLVVAGTGGQVLVFELKEEANEINSLTVDEVTIVSDQRFTWKGREKLSVRSGVHKLEPGYHVTTYVQLDPPVAATSLDHRTDWHLFAVGTSYGFLLYDYANKHSVINKCTLNVHDFAIVCGDAGAGAMSRKKSFRKSLRESFRRLRRGRSQRNQQVTSAAAGQATTGPKPFGGGRVTTGVRTLQPPSSGGSGANAAAVDAAVSQVVAHRNMYSTERQVEPKVELSSIVKCITLTSAVISNNASFKPTLWVGTNSGQVLVYAISLASEQKIEAANTTTTATSGSNPDQRESGGSVSEPTTTARLAKEIQLKHKAPIIAIFTSPEAPEQQVAPQESSVPLDAIGKSTPEKQLGDPGSPEKSLSESPGAGFNQTNQDSQDANEAGRGATPAPQASPDKASAKKDAGIQARVLICSEEQFKVFNLPNLKPFCKFKLTAHEGLRAKKISITQFLKPSSGLGSTGKQAALSASKSLQSFATQTSPPASPVPPAEGSQLDESNSVAPTGEAPAGGGKQAESNNNSNSALNHNSSSGQKDNSKELLNAKFGAKQNSNTNDQLKDLASETDSGNLFEPYMVCMSNQGDCAIYSVPDLKRQAQIQVCKREDINGITSTMLTNYGEGYYLKSSSNFLRFSISTQRVLRVLSVV